MTLRDRPTGRSAQPEATRLKATDDPALPLAQRYEALVQAIRTHSNRPFIGAALEHARPVSLDAETLVLAMPRGLYHDGVSSTANRRALESLVRDHFGQDVQVRVELDDAVKTDDLPEAIAVRKERELKDQTDAIRAEALSNPGVRIALEALDGEIEDIRILSD